LTNMGPWPTIAGAIDGGTGRLRFNANRRRVEELK
jgi:hypothetical protein